MAERDPRSTTLPAATAAALLRLAGVEADGTVRTERIGAGQSNLTYAVGDGTHTWVLRRPPHGPLLPSAHDVVREAGIMEALHGTGVPVPRILGVVRDTADVPWVVMSHVEGHVVADARAARRLSPGSRSALGLELPRTLARVHRVDLERAGLSGLAGHAPYAPRQLRRWTAQWESSRTTDLPALDRLTDRLTAATPAQTEVTLVHGDFHLGNVITRGPGVAAVLDWELSTLGDPLADVGTLLAYWTSADELPASPPPPSSVTGFPDRRSLVEEYARASGRDTRAVGFWHVLGLWKVAIIAQGVFRRAQDDPRNRAATGTPSPRQIEDIVRLAHAVAQEAGI